MDDIIGGLTYSFPSLSSALTDGDKEDAERVMSKVLKQPTPRGGGGNAAVAVVS